MMADKTSASSGDTTRSLSSSVFDGMICSRGTISPVDVSRYWIRLWWLISSSSSIRQPFLGVLFLLRGVARASHSPGFRGVSSRVSFTLLIVVIAVRGDDDQGGCGAGVPGAAAVRCEVLDGAGRGPGGRAGRGRVLAACPVRAGRRRVDHEELRVLDRVVPALVRQVRPAVERGCRPAGVVHDLAAARRPAGVGCRARRRGRGPGRARGGAGPVGPQGCLLYTSPSP